MYYNTTNEKEPVLNHLRGNAMKQDEIVLDFFKNNDSEFTPCEVLENAFTKNVPLTSVRRSITNLEGKGILIKTATKRIGLYGRFNYCWKLNK